MTAFTLRVSQWVVIGAVVCAVLIGGARWVGAGMPEDYQLAVAENYYNQHGRVEVIGLESGVSVRWLLPIWVDGLQWEDANVLSVYGTRNRNPFQYRIALNNGTVTRTPIDNRARAGRGSPDIYVAQSPDGQHYIETERVGSRQIVQAVYLVDWVTGEREAIPLDFTQSHYRHLSWSPDGDHLIVMTSRIATPNSPILFGAQFESYVYDLADRSLILLDDHPSAETVFYWLDEQQVVLSVSYGLISVYTLPLDGRGAAISRDLGFYLRQPIIRPLDPDSP